MDMDMECKYDDYGDVGSPEEVKQGEEKEPQPVLASPARFATIRSAGHTCGGGIFLNLLGSAMKERERAHDVAMARDMQRRLDAEAKTSEAARAQQEEEDNALARRIFEKERGEVAARQLELEEKAAFQRWAEEERRRHEEDAEFCARLQAEEEKEAKRAAKQATKQAGRDRAVASRLQRQEAAEVEKSVKSMQAAWRKPRVERIPTDRGIRFEVHLPSVERATVMLDGGSKCLCLKAESYRFALPEDVAAVALPHTKRVLDKRNTFSLELNLTGPASVSEDGVSYFYDRRRAVLSLVLEDESLRGAEAKKEVTGILSRLRARFKRAA